MRAGLGLLPIRAGHFVMGDFGFGSNLPVGAPSGPRPESGVKPKQFSSKPTFGRELPLLGVLLPWMAPPPDGES